MIRFHFDIQQYYGLHRLALTFPSELCDGTKWKRLSATQEFASSTFFEGGIALRMVIQGYPQ